MATHKYFVPEKLYYTTIENVIDHDTARMCINYLVVPDLGYSDWRRRPRLDDLGGLEWVNDQGKVTKRLRRNYYNRTGLTIPDDELERFGNNLRSYSPVINDDYVVQVSTNMDVWSSRQLGPKAGMENSCFRPNGIYHDNWQAMQDSRIYFAMRIWRGEDGDVSARAWVREHYRDKSLTLFNAYGMSLRAVALIASNAMGLDLGWANVHGGSTVYVNSSRAAVLYRGDRCPLRRTSFKVAV